MNSRYKSIVDHGAGVRKKGGEKVSSRAQRYEDTGTIKVKIVFEDTDKVIASCLNISESGMLAKLAPGKNGIHKASSKVSLTMMTESGIITKVHGELVRSNKRPSKASSGSETTVAFRFGDIDPKNSNNLKRLISTLV